MSSRKRLFIAECGTILTAAQQLLLRDLWGTGSHSRHTPYDHPCLGAAASGPPRRAFDGRFLINTSVDTIPGFGSSHDLLCSQLSACRCGAGSS